MLTNNPKIDAILTRAKSLLIQPKVEWEKISPEPGTMSDVLMDYVLILAAVPAVAGFIGKIIFGYSILGVTYRPPFFSALMVGVFGYIGNILSIFIASFVIDFFAPKFGGEKNQTQAFKLAAYAATAGWVAGILTIIPALGIIAGLCSLYSIYLFYLGLPVLMKTSEDQSVACAAASIITTIVVSAVVFAVILALMPGATYASMMAMGPVIAHH